MSSYEEKIANNTGKLIGKGACGFCDSAIIGTITRPANTTQYAVDDIINSSNATTLVPIDLSSIGAVEGSKVQITACRITSNFYAASTKLQAEVNLRPSSTFSSQSIVDNVACTGLTAAETRTRRKIAYTDFSSAENWKNSGGYEMVAENLSKIATVGANGILYANVIAKNAYTPASGEVITVQLEGYLL